MVKLAEVAEAIGAKSTRRLDTEALAITHTTKNCSAGDIFVAIKGFRADGNDFIPQAIERGAVAIISERPCPAGFALPWLQVEDARRALSCGAAAVYRHPSRALKLVG